MKKDYILIILFCVIIILISGIPFSNKLNFHTNRHIEHEVLLNLLNENNFSFKKIKKTFKKCHLSENTGSIYLDQKCLLPILSKNSDYKIGKTDFWGYEIHSTNGIIKEAYFSKP